MELFTMVQSTARNCGDFIPTDQLNTGDIVNCGWVIDDMGTTVFIAPEPCLLDGEHMGFACYNNPTEDNYIFTS